MLHVRNFKDAVTTNNNIVKNAPNLIETQKIYREAVRMTNLSLERVYDILKKI